MLVRCVSKVIGDKLTIGVIYDAVSGWNDPTGPTFWIIDDNGGGGVYFKTKFVLLEDERDDKLNNIGI